MDVGKLVGHLISLGYVLAALGLLSVATRAIRQEAADTQEHGMVSLGAWNRALTRSPRH